MRWLTLLLLLGLMAPYGGAQDEDEDDEPEIEIGEDPGKTEKVKKDKPKPKPEQGKPPPNHPPVRGRDKPDDEKSNKPATIERINAAIDAGVAFLIQRQHKDGSWGPCVSGGSYSGEVRRNECYHIGPTAFSIFTLRKCGVPRKAKVIKAGLKWLKKRCRKAQYTRNDTGYWFTSYETSALIMMLAALNEVDVPPHKRKKKKKPHKFAKKPDRPPPGVKFKKDEWKWMDDRVRALVQHGRVNMMPFQNKGGGWRYWPARGDQDLSATQFALLGLRAAAQAGYPVHLVSRDTWTDAATAVRTFRTSAGGFRYHKADTPWTLGMTTAGIASLIICKEQMALAGQEPPLWFDDEIKRALGLLGERFDFERNVWPGMETAKERPHGVGYHYYYLYGIERVGQLSGKKEIGGKSWYSRGATFLVNAQQGDGKWVDSTCMDPEDVLGTCFALLFLKKATPPAVTVSR